MGDIERIERDIIARNCDEYARNLVYMSPMTIMHQDLLVEPEVQDMIKTIGLKIEDGNSDDGFIKLIPGENWNPEQVINLKDYLFPDWDYDKAEIVLTFNHRNQQKMEQKCQ
jgi:hypothetical protein